MNPKTINVLYCILDDRFGGPHRQQAGRLVHMERLEAELVDRSCRPQPW